MLVLLFFLCYCRFQLVFWQEIPKFCLRDRRYCVLNLETAQCTVHCWFCQPKATEERVILFLFTLLHRVLLCILLALPKGKCSKGAFCVCLHDCIDLMQVWWLLISINWISSTKEMNLIARKSMSKLVSVAKFQSCRPNTAVMKVQVPRGRAAD